MLAVKNNHLSTVQYILLSSNTTGEANARLAKISPEDVGSLLVMAASLKDSPAESRPGAWAVIGGCIVQIVSPNRPVVFILFLTSPPLPLSPLSHSVSLIL